MAKRVIRYVIRNTENSGRRTILAEEFKTKTNAKT